MGMQLGLDLKFRGGKRPGAGRPRTRPHPGLDQPGVPHLRRKQLNGHDPVHVTLRVVPGTGYLRAQRQASLIQGALRAAREKFGMRIIHFSIQGAHLHLILETADRAALSKGMQALGIRIARGLNRLAGNRRGPVFVDRYHEHVLESRRQVANAVRYVLENFRHHVREPEQEDGADPLSSAVWQGRPVADDSPVVEPGTWKLKHPL